LTYLANSAAYSYFLLACSHSSDPMLAPSPPSFID